MSQESQYADHHPINKPVPAWLLTGIVGLLVGGGATFAALHNLGYRFETSKVDAKEGVQPTKPAGMPPMAGGGGPGMPGMPGMGGMGIGGMGMGGMMGMGGGGGGGGKRALTSLVGKLELLSRPGIK